MKAQGKFASFKKKLGYENSDDDSMKSKSKSKMNFSSKKGKLREALKRHSSSASY